MKKLFFLVTLLVLSEGLTAQFLRQPNAQIEDVKPFSEQFGLVKISTDEKSAAQWHFWYLQDTVYQKEGYNNALPYSEGFAAFKRKGNKAKGAWQFINTKGEVQGNQYDEVRSFKNGLAAVKKNKKWGFIDTFFKQVIDFQYLEAFDFSENRCKVILQHPISGNFNHLMMDTKGKVIAKFDSLGNVCDGLAIIANRNGDGDIGYVDTIGETVKEIKKLGKLKYARPFKEGYAAITFKKSENTLKYMDVEGNLLDISIANGLAKNEEERYLHDFKEKRAAVQVGGGKWQFIDENGKKLYTEFKSVTPFSEGFAAVQGNNDDWFFIHIAKGDTAFNRSFQQVKPFSNNVAWVRTKDGWGLVTSALPPIIDDICKENQLSKLVEVTTGQPGENQCMTVIQPQLLIKTNIQSFVPLSKVELFVNGQNAIVMEPIPTNQGYMVKYLVDLQAGDNHISIKAQNIGGVAEKSICILYDNLTQYKALLFANNDYKFCPYHLNKERCVDADHWCDLDKPIEDADKLAKILREQYQFSSIQVVQNATKNQMITAFEQLAKSKQPNDHILIFYAGHGYYKEEEGCPYLIPIDAINENKGTYFSMDEFVSSIAKIECAEQVLTIIDACYGGAFTTSAKCSSVATNIDEPKRSNTKSKKVINTKCSESKSRARHIITSGHISPVFDNSQFLTGVCEFLTKNQLVEMAYGVLSDTVANWLEKQKNNDNKNAQYGRLSGNGIPEGSGRFKFRKKI